MKKMNWRNPLAFLLPAGLVIVSVRYALPVESASVITHRTIEVTLNEGTNMAAALSPDEQTLVVDLLGRLWLLPVGGGTAQPITDELGDARQPAWSPDGRRIAFQAYWNGNWHVYTIGEDGKNLQQHTAGPFDHREPHWSPDGRRIAFSSDRAGSYDIWTIELEAGQLDQRTTEETNEYAPAWSPDGTQLAFVSDDPDAKGIKVLALREEKSTLVYASDDKLAGVTWSADGQSFFFQQLSFAASRLMRKTIGDPENKAAPLSNPEEDVFPFRVNPSTRPELIYTSSGKIRRRSLTGKKVEEIPFRATVQLDRPAYARRQRDFDPGPPEPVRGLAWPAVSPDGTAVAFVALGDLWLQRAEGPAEQLTSDAYVEMTPAWSPDGRSLAYLSDRGGQFAVWIWDFEQKKSRKLSEIEGSPAGIAWSPDGRKIACSTSFGPRLGQVWTIDVGAGQVDKVGSRLSSSIGSPTWSADGQIIGVGVLQPYSSLYREGINRILYLAADGSRQWGLRALEHWSLGVRGKDGPVWSPDGRRLALISQGLLWIAPVDREGQISGPPVRLTNELADMPSWTADSKSLLFLATDRLKKIDLESGRITEFPVRLEWSRHAPMGRTVIHAGGLFDGIKPELTRNVDIIIDRNRIVAIEPHDPDRLADKKIDASDRFVLPGLIDYHAHQGSWDGEQLNRKWLSWGVIATRDPATDPYDALNRKEAQESGRVLGPRIFFTGSPIDGSRVYYSGTYAQQSPAQVEMELQRAEALGYDLIKTYVRLPDPLQKRVVERAHRIGVPVSSHELYPAAAYGIDGVEHIEGTSRRGYSPKITGILRSYGDVSELIAASGMTFTPTTGIYVSYDYLLARNESALDDRRLQRLETPFALASAWQRIAGVRANPEGWEKRLRNALHMVKDVHDKGGMIVAGTDSPILPFGFGLHLELEAYAEAGLSVFEVLQTAAINAARALGAGEDLGSVEPGKLADLIIVDKNPLENIRNIRDIRWVVQNGEVYTMEELLTPLGK